jgi:hypothetical protein
MLLKQCEVLLEVVLNRDFVYFAVQQSNSADLSIINISTQTRYNPLRTITNFMVPDLLY